MNKGRDEVLGTAELLEHVLLHLELKTLLIAAQRVNRKWRELIRDSPTLQRRLFFQSMPVPNDANSGPASTSPAAHGAHTNDSILLPRELNPLLMDKFAVFFYEKDSILDHIEPTRGGRHPTDVHKMFRESRAKEEAESLSCTLSLVTFECLLPAFVNNQEQERRQQEAEAETGSAAAAVEAFLLGPEASWRKMLVSHPPVRHLGFFEQTNSQFQEEPGRWGWSGHPWYRYSELHLDDGDGLRMGELYDAVASWVGRHRWCTIAWKPAAVRGQSLNSRALRPRDRAAK